MEINGKEFLRNIEIEKEKDALHQQTLKLDAEKRSAIKPSTDILTPNSAVDKEENEDPLATEKQSAYIDLTIDTNKKTTEFNNTLDQNRLASSSKNKKYILLGLGLILIFIITILSIRLITNSEAEKELLDNDSKIVNQKDILTKLDTNEQYQEIINKNEKQTIAENMNNKEQKNLDEIVLPKVEDTPIVIDTPKQDREIQKDLFGLEQKDKPVAVVIKEQKIKKMINQENHQILQKKQKVKSKPKKKVKAKINSNKGYFIQIGAFTKPPTKKLLTSIITKGYNYQIKQITVKGRIYNKVLIGTYATKSQAQSSLKKVKKDFNKNGAYIIRF